MSSRNRNCLSGEGRQRRFDNMRAQFLFRIRIIVGLIALVAVVVVVRLYFLQIVNGEEYALKADRQFSAGSSGLFDRGSIFFTRKDGTLISAATLSTGFLVAINPQVLENPSATYQTLAALIPGGRLSDHDQFLSMTEKKGRVYVEVGHHLTQAEGQAISALNISGIQVLRERWRQYPGKTLAAQSIGIVSYGSEDSLAGRTGIEATYEDALARTGDSLYRNFFAELFSNVGNMLVSARDAREGDLVTTIEPEVQARLEHDLAQVTEKYSSTISGGIIMDPKTGSIIALATYPTYDANNLSSVDPSVLGNPLVEHVYEFGSIMKPLSMASALDVGAITPQTTYNDTGCITVDTKRICNWDQKARGVIPVGQIIMQSLNVGSAWVATKLGQDRFREYFTKLFGDKTHVDLPNEGHALLANLSKPQQIGYDTAAFGQGIAVTPIQMIRALGALANNGVMVQPHLVSGIRLKSGVTRSLDWSTTAPVFGPDAVRSTTSMMVSVMDEKLENGKAIIPTMSVATKTGTAQMVDPKGGYYLDRYFHSFTGFFPAYNPRFIILLFTHDPKGVQYASETLVPSFLDLTHFLIDYYAVPPDRGIATSTPSL